MTRMAVPELDINDFATSTWIRFEAVLEDRLEDLRKRLEQDKSEVETAEIRGRIREIRRVLDLNKSSQLQADAE